MNAYDISYLKYLDGTALSEPKKPETYEIEVSFKGLNSYLKCFYIVFKNKKLYQYYKFMRKINPKSKEIKTKYFIYKEKIEKI